MIKNLIPVGNSLGLIIDRPILKLLNIDRNTELEITTDGKTLSIRPVTGSSHTPRKHSIKKTVPDTSPETEEQAASVKEVARSFLDEFKQALK